MNTTAPRVSVPLAVLATTIVVSSGEYLAWAGLGESNEWTPIAVATVAVALIATTTTALLSRIGWRWRALFGGLVLAWAPFASVSIVRALLLGAAFVATAGIFVRARPRAVATLTAGMFLTASAHDYGSQRPPSRNAQTQDAPDIVLIVMDTTRSDHLSVYGYDKPTTPQLERFAEHARVYDDAWSVAPWTSPSHASMFTGLLPAEHGVDGALAIAFPGDIPTLPEVLSRAGYRTAGFPGNPNLFAPGWERGFDVYLPAELQKSHSLIRVLNDWSRRWRDPSEHALGDQLLARARRWWSANDDNQPRFLFVNLIEPHSPYIPSDEFYEALLHGIPRERALAVQARMRPDGSASPPWNREEIDILGRLYDAEIAGMDRRIGDFVQWLDARGELDDTLFAITSDHGERLGERGLVGHSLVMDPYLLRVPLLVSYPTKLEPGRSSERVQLDGLAGTLLELAGIRASDAMVGFSRSHVAVAQYRPPVSIVDDMHAIDAAFDAETFRQEWTFVTHEQFALEWSASATPVLTDLEADPDFTRNVATDFPEETETLLAIATGLPRFEQRQTLDVDPSLMKKLKMLGYVR